MRRIFAGATALLIVAGALVVALGASGASTKSASAATAARGAPSAVVSVRKTKLGKTLVDGRGRTLYLFEGDRANMSYCTTSCLTVWPAFTTNAKPHAHGGALAGKLGTIAVGGRRQVTYAGHPLYHYVGDRRAGDAGGQALKQFGAKWYVLSPAGSKIDND